MRNHDCQYCNEPLDHGVGRIINGLHEKCHEQFNLEMLSAFPEEQPGPMEPEFFVEQEIYC